MDNPNLPGILNFAKLKTSFKYYLLLYKGDLKGAEEFLGNYHPSKTASSEIVDPYCLLFHVAKLGRWDIFETYQQTYKLPENFNFSFTVENSEFRPIMIAAFCGRKEVVQGLLHKVKREDLKQTIQGKTAAQLARERGFTDIASMIELRAGLLGILPNAIAIAPIESDTETKIKTTLATITSIQTEFETALERAKVQTQSQCAVTAPVETSESDDDDDNYGYETADGEDELLNEEIVGCGLVNARVEITDTPAIRLIPIDKNNFPTALAQARFFKELKKQKPDIEYTVVDGREVIEVPLERKPKK